MSIRVLLGSRSTYIVERSGSDPPLLVLGFGCSVHIPNAPDWHIWGGQLIGIYGSPMERRGILSQYVPYIEDPELSEIPSGGEVSRRQL